MQPQLLQLYMNPLHGPARLVSSSIGRDVAEHAGPAGKGIHLTATICRVRQTKLRQPAASKQPAQRMLGSIAIPALRKGIAAVPAASWAAISAQCWADDIAVPTDCCLHLGAVFAPQQQATRSLRIPVAAASHVCSSTQPVCASACAVPGGHGSHGAAASVTDHVLSSEASSGRASTHSLVTRPMGKPAISRPELSVPSGASMASLKDDQPQLMYEILHCVTAPARQHRCLLPSAAAFATPRVQRTKDSGDGLLRGMAASLQTAKQAHTAAARLEMHTAGALCSDGGNGPHGTARPMQAAHGSASWSLARCLQAEVTGELQCTGSDSATAQADLAVCLELQPRDASRFYPRADADRGIDERLSMHSGGRCITH